MNMEVSIEHPIKRKELCDGARERECERKKERKWKFPNKTTYRIGNGWIL